MSTVFFLCKHFCLLLCLVTVFACSTVIYYCVCLVNCFFVCLIKNPPKRCAWRALKLCCFSTISLSHPPSIDQRQDYFDPVSMNLLLRLSTVSLKTVSFVIIYLFIILIKNLFKNGRFLSRIFSIPLRFVFVYYVYIRHTIIPKTTPAFCIYIPD